jgi:uncharacterized protein (TIGR02246 family)
MTQDEDAIRALVEDWAKAVREKNMDGVLANHADDILMFDVPLPLQSQGMAEYKKTWELFFKHNPGGPGAFDLTELHVFAGDTVAYCHAIIDIFGTKARLTIGLRKESQWWLIAHEHHSYPIEIETEK